DAVEARAAIVRLLGRWSARLVTERGVRHPGTRRIGVLSRFLIRHVDWLAAHPGAGTFAGELRCLVRAAHDAADNNPAADRVEVGTCVDPHCDRAVVMTVSPAAGATVRCEAGHVWPPNQWLALARRLGRLGRSTPVQAAS